jgi:DNA-directed RNA polymerase specialized sigma24 family protein
VEEMIKYLRASIFLQAEMVANLEGATKPEVLLGLAGLSHREIASIVRKSQPAVSKAINRASKGASNEGD